MTCSSPDEVKAIEFAEVGWANGGYEDLTLFECQACYALVGEWGINGHAVAVHGTSIVGKRRR